MKTAQDHYQEFLRLKEKPVLQRARGIPYKRLFIWNVNFFLLVAAIMTPIAWYLRENLSPVFWLFALLIAWLTWNLPGTFYHQENRRKRYLKRKYPQVYRAVLSLRNKGESILYDIPSLHIEKKTYFLVSYFFRQPWWQLRPSVKLTGWMLFDANGAPVQDTQLFAKAFVTMAYADTGAVTSQGRNGHIITELHFGLRKYLPRAEQLLRRKEEFLRVEGFTYEWQEITERMPLFYQAAKDAMLLYDIERKFAHAIGYSFGYDFWYEDAVHMEKVYRAYGEYMRLSYQQDIMTVLDRHLKAIWNGVRWNHVERYVLDLFGRTLATIVQSCIWFPLDAGKPTASEWGAYIRRLEVVRRKGFSVVGTDEVQEEYPFKGVLFHDDPFWHAVEEA